MRSFFLALFTALAFAVPATSQAQSAAARFSFALAGQPLDDALDTVVRTIRFELAYDPALTEGKQTTCAIRDAPLNAVLACVLEGTGLTFRQLPSGLYILEDAPAERAPVPGQLSGLVLDGESGEPLPFANVQLLGANRGTATNLSGRFSFPDLLPGPYRLAVTYVGYGVAEQTVVVAPAAHAHVDIHLTAHPVAVPPVIIDGLQWRLPSSRLGAASTTFTQDTQIIGLTASVSQELGSLMGVSLHDATSEIHVQGGRSGDHQFRIDGVPLFLPANLGSFIGPFSPFAVGRLTVHKAGYGAAEGSQLSGVIDVDHAMGSPAPHALDVQVDALSLNARVRLHSPDDRDVRATFMSAARYSLWGLYTAPPVLALLEDWNRTDPLLLAAFGLPDLAPDALPGVFTERTYSTGNPSLGFLDLHSALRLRFGPLRSLYASGYWGERQVDSDRDPFVPDPSASLPGQRFFRDFYTWETAAGQIRYESVLNTRTMATVQVHASHYDLQHDYGPGQEPRPSGLDDQNRIHEVGGALRVSYIDGRRFDLDAGLEPSFTRSRFVIQGTREVPIDHDAADWRLAAFVENKLTPNPNTIVETGMRFTYLPSHRRVFAEPRLALRYDRPESAIGPWAMRIGLGLYRQFVSQFDVSSRSPRALLSTSRVWLNVDSSVSPQRASHVATEFLLQPAPSWTLRFEGYLKHLLHLLALNYAAVPVADSSLTGAERFPQRAFLRSGSGYAHGAALQVEKQLEGLRLEARYEYSFAERSLETLFRGGFDPVPWNEPHQLLLAADWLPSTRLTLRARWRSVWGRTWGFRQAYYDFFGAHDTLSPAIPAAVRDVIQRHVEAYGLDHPRNHRLPALHQLDLSAAYTVPLGAASLQARIDLVNVLGRDNVADWRFAPARRTEGDTLLLVREDRRLLPFTPAFALRISR